MRAVMLGSLSAMCLGGCVAQHAPEPYSRDMYAVSTTPDWAMSSGLADPVPAGGSVHHVSASKGSSPLWDQDAVMDRQIARRARRICGSLGYSEIGRLPASIYQNGGATQFDYDVIIQCLK